jgi:altronate dehydratase
MSLSAADALIRLHPDDDVAVVRRRILAGESAGELTFQGSIPAAHKVALRPLAQGTPVRKYGQFIGRASMDIPAGAHVHVHNLDTGELSTGDHFLEPTAPWPLLPESERLTFQGFTRPGGRAGTRNYVAVISSVNCSASVSQFVARRFTPETLRRDFPGVDGADPAAWMAPVAGAPLHWAVAGAPGALVQPAWEVDQGRNYSAVPALDR